MDEEESILKEFLVECAEGIGRLEQEFVVLEKEPGNYDLLASIFRRFHTIKGTCGFLGLPKLETVAHGAENILSRMRDKKMTVTPDRITVLLQAVDAIKEILSHIESGGKEPPASYDDLRSMLDAVAAGEAGSQATPTTDPPPKPPAAAQPDASRELAPAASAPTEAADAKAEAEPTTSGAKTLAASESSIRVDVGLLDKLMNMVGELVLARNQLLQQVRTQDDAADLGTAQRMNLITSELQDTVMKTRMQPIRNVWDKLPRVVRDLARSNGKQVELVMQGADTELDKTLLEAIKDPLTHIVRNAVDHGIEKPEVRQARGKPPGGTLSLKAYHEGGRINIEIEDDGGGIDAEKVKQKAVQKGVLSADAVAHLSEREAFNLIFLPGLSTAEKVTNVSGRGVGMDVVKTNIERIGGIVEISSRLGSGTSLRIKIPLTLAIIPALVVRAGGDRFAIPQASLKELVRIDVENGEGVEVIRGAEFYRLRGALLPLLRLNRMLDLTGQVDTPQPGGESREETTIVVLGAGNQRFGLIVEEVCDSEEIVVKPLGRHLKGLGVFAGATIMGDGRVALILDVMGLAKTGKLAQPPEAEALASERGVQVDASAERETLLVFSVTGTDRYAVPLALVARLEEFAIHTIEPAAGREVIQYRGDLLPVIRLARVLGLDASYESERLPAVVFSRGSKSVGLVVRQILDIVDVRMALYPPPEGRAGVRGSIVIEGQTTDVLDIDHVIEKAEPGWARALAGAA